MPRAQSAQLRILKLIEILSGEEPMKPSAILRRLEKLGICITRTTLKSDMALLRECGFDLKSVSLPTGEHYYIGNTQQFSGNTSAAVQAALKNGTQMCVVLAGHSGELTVSPYALLRNRDGFFALCYSPAHRRTLLLPFSKMISAHPSELTADPPPPDYSVSYYTERGFELCCGTNESVVFSFPDELLGDVRSRFGEAAIIRRDGPGLMSAAVSTEATPALFAWLFRLGGRVRIISPERVCREYKNSLRTRLAEL